MGQKSPLIRRLNRIQKGAVDGAVRALRSENKCLVVMTTGTGKTMVGAKIISQFPKAKVLWMTQTEELIEQSVLDLQKVFGEEAVGLYKRQTRSLLERVIVASVQTIEKEEYLHTIKRDAFDLIVVDEAHHAPANTWNKVLRYFKGKRLGLTATPVRGDGQGLEDIFGLSAFNLSYEEAKKYRLIAEEVYRVILTNSKVEGITTRSGEYKPNELDRLVISKNRNEIIVDSYKKYGRGFMRELGLPYKTICFCITVSHANRMKDLFLKNGIKADILISKHASSVSEGSPQTEKMRHEVYESFLMGYGPEILCVVNVLNEGKNIPDVGCLLMARPTRSAVIFQQQMGRGCRRIEGKKEKFVVLDYVDLINRKYPPMSLSKVTGKPFKTDQIVVDYYRGSDPIVMNEYVEYLSSDYSYKEEPRWTKRLAALSLKTFYKANGYLRTSDLGTKSALPSKSALLTFWPSVRECFEELKIPLIEAPKEWSKADVEAAIRYWLKGNDKISVTDLGSKNGLPSQKTIYRYWGTWRNCEKALGIETWDHSKASFAIDRFQKIHGRSPKKTEFTGSFQLPSIRVIQKLFGSISRAIGQ